MIITIPASQQLETCEKASSFRRKQGWGLPNLSSPYRTQYGELKPLVSKFLGMGNISGGFFPKLDEKYGDRDREYNWWGCSKYLDAPIVGEISTSLFLHSIVLATFLKAPYSLLKSSC